MKHFRDILVLPVPTTANPWKDIFNVDKGLITWCGIYFPPGCHGMVYAKVFFQAHQILPRDPDQWCHGNAGWWGGDIYFPVTAEPLTIRTEMHSGAPAVPPTPTTYQHTLTLGLELMPFEMVPDWERLLYLNEKLLRAMGVELPPLPPKEAKV